MLEKGHLVCFDLDGTLADLTHRLPYIKSDKPDWDGFFEACDEDEPIPEMVLLNRTIAARARIYITSGRSNKVRDKTSEWLDDVGVVYHRLFMRREGDHRPDYKVKEEMLTTIRAVCRQEPILAVDDRQQVVDMWRRNGVRCLQCAKGDF